MDFSAGTAFVEDATAEHVPKAGLICVRCTFADGDYSSSGCLSQIVDSDSGSVVMSFLVPKTQHKTSQNCEVLLTVTGHHVAVVRLDCAPINWHGPTNSRMLLERIDSIVMFIGYFTIQSFFT